VSENGIDRVADALTHVSGTIDASHTGTISTGIPLVTSCWLCFRNGSGVELLPVPYIIIAVNRILECSLTKDGKICTITIRITTESIWLLVIPPVLYKLFMQYDISI
jgi:hypothetical protein